jgi:renalase
MARALKRIVVVGAGLSGLAAARTLADHGHEVVVLDKGRAPGGRSSTRSEAGKRSFDHGAQFFTARGDWLTSRLPAWEEAGVVARWAPRVATSLPQASAASSPDGPREPRDGETWWVGTPGMGSVAAHLARGLDVRTASTVTSVIRQHEAWLVAGSSASGARGDPATAFEHVADALVLAVPAPQCGALLGEALATSELGRQAAAAVLEPCWAAMIALSAAGEPFIDLMTSRSDPLAWAAREASKPGRRVAADEGLWTLHASAEWSRAHLEDDSSDVASFLAAALLDRLAEIERREGRDHPSARVTHASAHRRRFARPATSSHRGCLYDDALALALCGDWLQSARIEGALTSGVAAAARLLDADREPAMSG